MAAGSGSRLPAAAEAGSKALVPIGGRPLIDFVLDEFVRAGIDELAVVARADDQRLREFLAKEDRFSSVAVLDGYPDAGTLGSVVRLMEHFAGKAHLISTCDVIVLPGTIARMCDAAIPSDTLATAMTSTFVHDDDPIWVHVDGDVVCAFGKGLPPSGVVFGHIRYMSADAAAAFRDVNLDGVRRDTQAFGRLVAHYPGRIRHFDGGLVLDVDTDEDRLAAERMLA